MASSILLGSQSLVLATTAMVVSSTILFLTFSRHKPNLQKAPLQPCLLYPEGEKAGQKKKKNKKKRVKFAESVMEPRTNGRDFRRKQRRDSMEKKSCREFEISSWVMGMPANRVALYSGILLRDRAQRTECSY